jgi:Fe-S cluster biosynthesis and repair protein YggX
MFMNYPIRELIMPRMVQCVKLKRELPGLEKPPFPGELGKRIYENVSQEAWEMWPAQSTIIINHYGLNMADPSARKFLREQMEEFFFGSEVPMPEDWTPATDLVGAGSNAKGSKGGGGGASRKK